MKNTEIFQYMKIIAALYLLLKCKNKKERKDFDAYL